jgi:hypothetical protein
VTPQEREVLAVLDGLIVASRGYREQLEEARPLLEQLAADYWPAELLELSVVVAIAEPPRLGTPRHLEQSAREALRDLLAVNGGDAT